MAKRKGRGRKSGGRSANKASVNPPMTSQAYWGPVQQPQLQQQPMTRLLAAAGAVSADSSGNIKFVISNNPVNSADWSALYQLYGECRILGATFRWLPYYTTYSTSSTPLLASFLVIGAVRNGAAPAFANPGQALTNVPRQLITTGQRGSLTVKMNGSSESQWFNTTSGGPATASFTLSASALTVSATYGNYVLETLVQFRNPI